MGVNELHRIMAGKDEHSGWPPSTIDRIHNVAKSNKGLVKEKDDRSGWTPLHYGLKYRASGDAIKAILEAFPKAADMEDNNGHTPLALGLQEGSPADAIKALVVGCPHLAKAVDDSGRTPLHLAISYGRVDGDGIKAVLEARPQQAKVKDSDLRTPLHLCMKKGAPTEVIEAVLDAFPKAAEMADGNGQMPLHAGIQNGASGDAIEAVLKVYPESAAIEFRDGKLPLYRAIENGVSAEAIVALVEANPKAAEIKNNFGRTPLFLCLEKGASVRAIQGVLAAYPQGAEARDTNGYTPLHWGMGWGAPPEAITTIMDAFPEAAGMQDKDGLTPLFVGMEKNVPVSSIMTVLRAYPPAVEMQDNLGSTPLRYGILKGAPLDIIKCMLETWPYAANVRDKNGFTPLMIHVRMIYDEDTRDDDMTREEIKVDTNMLKMLADCYPEAGEVEDIAGLSPISFLINLCLQADYFGDLVADDTVYRLQLLMRGIRDGRPLKKLCITQNPVALQVFFSLFDQSGDLEQGESRSTPEIDLNREVIPGWTMLEILADVDNQEASNIIFQVVADQKPKLAKGAKDNLITISCQDQLKSHVNFCSINAVSERTMMAVADRAKLSNSSERLKRWGEEYGRFMGKYRIDKNMKPKHRSSNCVVLFGTELVPSEDDGRKVEEKVALKFLANEDAFNREIQQRQTILHNAGEDGTGYVAGLRAAYTTGTRHETSLRNVPNVFFRKELALDIAKYDNLLYLNPSEGTHLEINHLLVLDCGSGDDLSDVISHQDIAGNNLYHVLHAAISIARCLQFLNEECGMAHMDVKGRNFVSLEDGTNYVAIDLDNAVQIDEEIPESLQTSSGYLPPERAQVEYHRRCEEERGINGEALTSASDDLEELGKIYANAPEEYRPYIQKEMDRAQKEVEKLKAIVSPEEQVASSQYDMWCFGVLLYQLCTGQQLFRVDGHENAVNDEEIERIAGWSDVDLGEKLKLIPKDEGWRRIKELLDDLLQPDPFSRPESWGPVVSVLEMGSLSENQTIRNLESTTPDILTKIEIVKCPFLLRFVNAQEYSMFKKEKDGAKDTDQDGRTEIEIRFERAQNLLEWASGIIEDPTGLPAKPSKNMLKMALSKVARKKEEYIYLQLLCGWTLEPVISYKVSLDKHLERAKEIALLGAKMFTTGIKVSMLWNSGTSSARMLGYPMPLVSSEMIESAKDFLEGICSSDLVLELVSKKEEGVTPEDLNVLSEFLRELEEERYIKQILDRMDDVDGRWEDGLKREVVYLEGMRPQITFLSVKEYARLKAC